MKSGNIRPTFFQDFGGLLRAPWGFPGGSEGKASAYNAGDLGSIPGSGRKEMATHSSTLAWKIPWTEKPGRLQSMGSQRDTTEQIHFTSLG